MKKHFLLLLLIFLVSCKKEASKPMEASKRATVVFVANENPKAIPIDSVFLQQFRNKALTSFYESNGNQTVWQSPEQRKIVIAAFQKAPEEGLDPNEYGLKRIQDYEQKAALLLDKERAEYDVLLTNSFQKYLSQISNGRLNPRTLYKNWDLKPNKMEGYQAISSLLKSDSLAVKIELLKPQHLVYKRLKEALRIINGFPDQNFRKIKSERNLVLNDSNWVLLDIKKRLLFWKDLHQIDSLTAVYDTVTFKAIKKFQARHGLAADGIIGKGTLEALNFTQKQRRGQIIANLERWKWFPRAMGAEYIIINIPEYRLTLVKEKDTLRVHKVIVGRAKRKTPVLSSKLTQAVFNPTWTVPPTILREDVIPAILKSRSYLAKTNIKIYDASGNRVSAANWQLANAKSYRYVQSPGTFNSLGMVKLIFPNRFSVYLHDTNHRDFFDKSERSLSSGCIRVDNPLELTEYLLEDKTNWNLDKITLTLQSEKTKFVNLKKQLPFHLLYWTAWSDKNKLIFRDDIYSLDAELYSKLGN